ncbi:MAG: hypothetical protein MUF78_04350 [Candidatus Edwardsbacteria bacterium]|jgi:hypothetical protein|nr:hypothetical protein [Candidatus Edwardsbacteria bacterium]
MKSKHLLVLLAVLAAVIVAVGCSSLTQAPQLIVSNVSPFWVTSDSLDVTITLKNMNHIDAIVTTSQFTYRGAYGSDQSPVYNHSAYVPGNSDSTKIKVSVVGLTSIRTTLGSPVTLWMKFWGTDAYGYNKTFAIDSLAINCN